MGTLTSQHGVTSQAPAATYMVVMIVVRQSASCTRLQL